MFDDNYSQIQTLTQATKDIYYIETSTTDIHRQKLKRVSATVTGLCSRVWWSLPTLLLHLVAGIHRPIPEFDMPKRDIITGFTSGICHFIRFHFWCMPL